ncbi:MAG: hypothetical protein ACOC83_06695 [Gemmatimonadota bacterium]
MPAPLHAAFRKAKALTDWHTPVPVQAAAAELIDDGLLARHIRRMRRVYAERHERIGEVFAGPLAGHLRPVPSAGGLHVSAFLRGGGPSADLGVVERARSRGVALIPLSPHFVSEPARPGLLIGYGAVPSGRIEEGLRRVRECL